MPGDHLADNSCDHQEGLQKGLFSALVPLVPGVLPETALRVAARIQAIFDTLEQEAKDWVAEHREPRWIAAEKSDDKKFKDEMKKQEEAAVSAEYLRRRTAMLEGIQTWFQQVELLARGLAPEAGPCPELLAGLSRLPEISLETLPLVQKALGTLSACFHTNANEELALEAFCLEVARAGNLKA